MQKKFLTEELFNAIDDAVCLIGVNRNIIFSNQSFSKFFNDDEPADKNFIKYFVPEQRSEVQKLLDNCVETDKPLRTEKEILLRDKRKIWVEFTLSRIDSSEEKLFLVNLREITKRKQYELELLRSESKYRNVFNQANDPMFVCYLNYGETISNFIDVNEVACRNLGYSKEELLGMNPSSLMFNNNENEQTRIVERLWNDKHFIFTSTCITNDKRKIPNEISAHLFDLNDRPAVLFIARDLSQREEAENKIIEVSEKLRNLALHLQNVREEERAMIAREIHDELGQMLTYLKIQVTLAGKKIHDDPELSKNKIDSSLKLIDDSVEAVQRITSQLRPTLLDELGLAAAIDWQVKDFSARTGIQYSIQLPKDEPILAKEKLTAVFRIFQEALTNVARHANASKIFVTMNEFKNNLILEIRDNGKGITQSQVNSPNSLGVLGMKERALVFGGDVVIKSSMKSGTTVLVEVPME
ncbi:MAG: PAS domain S-box protein [Ignavibacteriales bacterium]|nr:MAG: PAS domain S-box protein [Ignavibacteriales bacterium]